MDIKKELSKADDMGAIMKIAFKIAEKHKELKDEFLNEYAQKIIDANKDKQITKEQGVQYALSNIGYMAGYYSGKDVAQFYKIFGDCHPIFGRV